MNVGPTADGRIAPVFEERLQQMGESTHACMQLVLCSHEVICE